jgi:transcription antitermination factor NusG
MAAIKWYVLGSVSRGQELKIRDELRRESLDCFVPLCYELKQVKGQRQRMMVPAIPGLMFVRGSLEDLKESLRFRKHGLFLRKSTFSNHEDYLTVPDRDMQNFIAFTEQAGERITYFAPDEIRLQPGDKIRVKGGAFDGREGIIQRIKGHRRKHLVVAIPNVVFAAVELTPDLVEVVDGPQNSQEGEENTSSKASKNVEEDKKTLFTLVKRLLFEIPTSYQHEKEYYLLLNEMKRTAARLQPIKAYLPALETELALALYLAAVKESLVAASTSSTDQLPSSIFHLPSLETRLRDSLKKLQPTSFLMLRAQLYLAKFAPDAELKAVLDAKLATWKQQKFSVKQKEILDEYQLIFG